MCYVNYYIKVCILLKATVNEYILDIDPDHDSKINDENKYCRYSQSHNDMHMMVNLLGHTKVVYGYMPMMTWCDGAV